MVSTTDFFYPLVDDPYLQGKIACANVLSDLYSMGIADCDTMLMILGASTEMEKSLQHTATELVMKGFNSTAAEAGTKVTGGQSVLNPWPIIGGVATAICREEEFIRPINARVGQVLVQTKPLGTQLAVNANEWMRRGELEQRAPAFVAASGGLAAACERVATLQAAATACMIRLNRNGARAMRDHGASAGTDITGFGVLGHARNLAQSQVARVRLQLDTLVVLRHTPLLASDNTYFGLLEGRSAETSGGLLVCIDEENADAFCAAVSAADGTPCWRVGRVVACDADQQPDAFIAKDVTIVEVDL